MQLEIMACGIARPSLGWYERIESGLEPFGIFLATGYGCGFAPAKFPRSQPWGSTVACKVWGKSISNLLCPI